MASEQGAMGCMGGTQTSTVQAQKGDGTKIIARQQGILLGRSLLARVFWRIADCTCFLHLPSSLEITLCDGEIASTIMEPKFSPQLRCGREEIIIRHRQTTNKRRATELPLLGEEHPIPPEARMKVWGWSACDPAKLFYFNRVP
ncbi:hypothetical protein Q7P37_001890 [Cladosporium fusiforme]